LATTHESALQYLSIEDLRHHVLVGL